MEKNVRLGFVVVQFGVESDGLGDFHISANARNSRLRSALLSEGEAVAWKRDYEIRKAAWEAKADSVYGEFPNLPTFEEIPYDPNDKDRALGYLPAVQIGDEIHILVRPDPKRFLLG